MNDLNTLDTIYSKILNKEIPIVKGIEFLLNFLQKSENSNLLLDCTEIVSSLVSKYKEIYDILIQYLKEDPKPYNRVIIAKLLIITFHDKCKKSVQEQIKRESSVIFLTSLFSFLNSQKTNISEILRKNLLKKYEKVYDLDYLECQFILDLENTQINIKKQLDISIGYFKKFETLNFNDFLTLTHVNYVKENRHIKALDLSRWEFYEIPESICFLSKLEWLNLSNLSLRYLPVSLGELTHLRYLNLSGNEIDELPKWLIEFAESQISINYLNDGVNASDAVVLALIEILIGKKLEKSEKINNLIHWDSALHFKLNNVGNVIGLYIKDESIKLNLFPKQICNLESLEELDFPDSSIRILPKCIGNLKILKHLNLYNNLISIVPETIEKLIDLEYLDLEDNEFSENYLLNLRWYKIGQHYFETGDFNNVINECKETLKVYPKNKYAWYHLGIAYKELTNYKDAEHAFVSFIDLDDTNSLVWSELSEIYHSIKEYNKAVNAIQHAIIFEPEEAVLYSNLAFNYKKLGKYQDAINAYSQSLEINPNNFYVWRDLASIYREIGAIDKAIEAEEHALELKFESK
ncbi:MAG: tetratricopeptide repeat protein [Promethearchaeota archaeon]